MNRVAFAFSTVALSFGFGAAGVAAQTSTMSGKLVDIATYITHDHNMDSMHAMSGEGDVGRSHDGRRLCERRSHEREDLSDSRTRHVIRSCISRRDADGGVK